MCKIKTHNTCDVRNLVNKPVSILSRFCPDPVSILSRFCLDSISILPRFGLDSVSILSRFCLDSVSIFLLYAQSPQNEMIVAKLFHLISVLSYKKDDSATVTHRALRWDFDLHNSPTARNWQNCEEIWRNWSGHKYWKACTSSFRSFLRKYHFCKWKCWRPKFIDSLSSSGIKNVLWHIMEYFAFRSTHTSI